MKFRLDLAGVVYKPEDSQRLQDLGFKFEPCRDPFKEGKTRRLERDGEKSVELNSIEELMKFIEKWGPVVIDLPNYITLYNDLIE